MEKEKEMSDPLREAEILQALQVLCDVARDRMMAADSITRGLHPAEVDWFNEEEMDQYDRLQIELIACQPTITEMLARVAARRAARLKEQP